MADHTTTDLTTAVKIFRDEMLKHDELYGAFIACTASALKDWHTKATDLTANDFDDQAVAIAERLLGEE